MRFYAILWISLFLVGPGVLAYQVDPDLLDPQVVGGGPVTPPGQDRSCLDRLAYYTEICTRHNLEDTQKYLDACEGVLGQNDPQCAANKCMRDNGYPLGINTDPANHCIVSIPRTPPSQGGNNQSDEEEVVSEESTVPIPRSRPQQGPPPPEPPQQQAQKSEDASSGGGGSPTANWQQESSQDIQQCSSLQSQANTCCNQPMSCSSELTQSQQQSLLDVARAAQAQGDQAGIEEICRQSKSMNVSSSNLNTGFANICYGKHSSCTATCSQALSKWQQRLNNCGANCDRPLVSQTVQALQGKTQQCQSYAALESRIRSQSFSSAEDAALAQLCEKNSGGVASAGEGQGGGGWGNALSGAAGAAGAAALPLLSGQNNPNGGYEDSSSYQQQSACALNPNAPGCYAPGYENEDPAGLSDTGGGSATPNDFNVGADNNFYSDYVGADNPSSESFSPQQVEGHRVPNEGGGGLPGQAGGGGTMSMASKQSSDADLPQMLGSGVNPNVLGEAQGRSGYSAPVGDNAGSGFEFKNRFGRIKGRAQVKSRSGKSFEGLDLKKYLPGGASDPRRRLAGISDFHPDIGPKHVDFFQRVSTRLQTICKLKRLLDCQ